MRSCRCTSGFTRTCCRSADRVEVRGLDDDPVLIDLVRERERLAVFLVPELAERPADLAVRHGFVAERRERLRFGLNERLAARLAKAPADPEPKAPSSSRRKKGSGGGTRRPEQSTAEKVISSSAFKQAARSAAAVVGREIARSIFGTRSR